MEPLPEPRQQTSPRSSERSRCAEGIALMNHILVVDDEAEIRTSLEEILREEGYGVATAATAAEALVLLQDAPYDVVLLDIWLPDRDGLDVLARYSPARQPRCARRWSSSAATAPSRPR